MLVLWSDEPENFHALYKHSVPNIEHSQRIKFIVFDHWKAKVCKMISLKFIGFIRAKAVKCGEGGHCTAFAQIIQVNMTLIILQTFARR